MKRILIIEKDDNICCNLSHLLNLNGYETYCAKTAAEAEDFLLSNEPALIISEILLPGKNGFMLLKTLRSNSSREYIPFIFLSDNIEVLDLLAVRKPRADYYLTKPYRSSDILRIIKSVLSDRRRIESG